MNFYQIKLIEKRNEALKAVLPIIGIVLLLSFTIPPGILLLFYFAAVLLIIVLIPEAKTILLNYRTGDA